MHQICRPRSKLIENQRPRLENSLIFFSSFLGTTHPKRKRRGWWVCTIFWAKKYVPSLQFLWVKLGWEEPPFSSALVGFLQPWLLTNYTSGSLSCLSKYPLNQRLQKWGTVTKFGCVLYPKVSQKCLLPFLCTSSKFRSQNWKTLGPIITDMSSNGLMNPQNKRM